uniref:Uncharacterized protein n=1 Tax=Timema douglasi TaxID=61478 RepID=A0A7R8VB42_TIMDO|nr:unnamed protein product [Timema douglasi]
MKAESSKMALLESALHVLLVVCLTPAALGEGHDLPSTLNSIIFFDNKSPEHEDPETCFRLTSIRAGPE